MLEAGKIAKLAQRYTEIGENTLSRTSYDELKAQTGRKLTEMPSVADWEPEIGLFCTTYFLSGAFEAGAIIQPVSIKFLERMARALKWMFPECSNCEQEQAAQ